MDKIKKSLRLSVIEGSLWAVMAGFAEFYIQAFAIFLKATNFQLGLIASLPVFLGTLSQLFTTKLVRYFSSKKRFVWTFAFFHGIMWIPILFSLYVQMADPVWLLILLTCIYWILGTLPVPAWSSWMAELVESANRGRYFGSRNRTVGFVSFAAYSIGGIVLYYSQLQYGSPETGFIVLFLLAAAARTASSFLLSKQYEVTEKFSEPKVNFSDFIRKITKENYGYLTLFLALMNFSVYIAAPYFAAYMLNELRLSYLEFMIINAVALVVKFLFMPLWGRVSDEYGTLKILGFSSFLIPLVPLFWMISPNVPYLVCVQIFAGFAWAGFELGSFNFILDTANPSRRIQYISYYNIVNGLFILIGSMAGALILKFNHLFASKFLLVFLISGAARYVVVFVLLKKLKEVRVVAPVKYSHMLFRMITMLPTTGAKHHIFVIGNRNK
jgi:MFS family permease